SLRGRGVGGERAPPAPDNAPGGGGGGPRRQPSCSCRVRTEREGRKLESAVSAPGKYAPRRNVENPGGRTMPARPPFVAGRFYPAEPDRLRESIRVLLAGATERDRTGTSWHSRPKALILPHAGYRFSGTVAASGDACLAPWTS